VKILILALKVPYPLHYGYNLRIFHYVRNLYSRHKFYLLCYENDPFPEELNKYFEKIIVVKRNLIPKPSSLIKRLYNAFSVDDIFEFNKQIDTHLRIWIKQENFDLIWISGYKMFVYLDSIHNIPVLGDVIDDPLLYYGRQLKKSKNLKSFLCTAKWMFNLFRFERKYFRKVTKCMVVSEIDAKFLKKVCPGLPVVVLPNGVDINFFKPMGLPEENFNLIFEGSMDYPPNEDAVIYFCKRIFPLIKKEIPNVKFFIVGKNPTKKVNALATTNIVVTGFVSDIRPYLEKASVFVCPMRIGAGIKNKILQAWAMAKPVVATSASLGGLKANPGQNIIVTDSPEKFAKETINLLRNKDKRYKLGIKARETVERYYSWQTRAQELEKIFFSLIAKCKLENKILDN